MVSACLDSRVVDGRLPARRLGQVYGSLLAARRTAGGGQRAAGGGRRAAGDDEPEGRT